VPRRNSDRISRSPPAWTGWPEGSVTRAETYGGCQIGSQAGYSYNEALVSVHQRIRLGAVYREFQERVNTLFSVRPRHPLKSWRSSQDLILRRVATEGVPKLSDGRGTPAETLWVSQDPVLRTRPKMSSRHPSLAARPVPHSKTLRVSQAHCPSDGDFPRMILRDMPGFNRSGRSLRHREENPDGRFDERQLRSVSGIRLFRGWMRPGLPGRTQRSARFASSAEIRS